MQLSLLTCGSLKSCGIYFPFSTSCYPFSNCFLGGIHSLNQAGAMHTHMSCSKFKSEMPEICTRAIGMKILSRINDLRDDNSHFTHAPLNKSLLI